MLYPSELQGRRIKLEPAAPGKKDSSLADQDQFALYNHRTGHYPCQIDPAGCRKSIVHPAIPEKGSGHIGAGGQAAYLLAQNIIQRELHRVSRANVQAGQGNSGHRVGIELADDERHLQLTLTGIRYQVGQPDGPITGKIPFAPDRF